MSLNPLTIPDTDTILRYLLKDHPELSERAIGYWESVRQGHTAALVTEGVIMECVHVLQRFYKVPRKEIISQLSILLSYKGLRKEGLDIFLKALHIYELKSIDFVDCLLIAIETAGIGTVFSFDKEIKKILGSSQT